MSPADPVADDSFRAPSPHAVANRHALMVVRLRRTGKWHIAFVPKGARFNDPAHVHIFKEYEFATVQEARAKMKDAQAEIRKKADKLRQEVPNALHARRQRDPDRLRDRDHVRGKAVDKKS